MAHTGYTIQMKVKKIKIVLLNGSQKEGQIFVSEYSPMHAGEEKVSEYFEQDALFFPFKEGNDLHLLSKEFVIYTEYPSEDDYSIYPKIEAEITIFGGKSLTLTVPISAPAPNARLSDQLNLKERFLTCIDFATNTTYLINKMHIVSVKEKK